MPERVSGSYLQGKTINPGIKGARAVRAWKDPAAEITAKEQGDSCINYQDGEGGLAGGGRQGCHTDRGSRVTGSHIQISGQLLC